MRHFAAAIRGSAEKDTDAPAKPESNGSAASAQIMSSRWPTSSDALALTGSAPNAHSIIIILQAFHSMTWVSQAMDSVQR
jgi:hypothetical protein